MAAKGLELISLRKRELLMESDSLRYHFRFQTEEIGPALDRWQRGYVFACALGKIMRFAAPLGKTRKKKGRIVPRILLQLARNYLR